MKIIEGTYGWSNGDGPRHILTETADGPATLCGVRRFTVGRAVWTIKPECPRCLRRRKGAELFVDEVAARETLRRALAIRGVQQGVSLQLNDLLRLARDNGFTLTELGGMLGVTRQAVHQRCRR